MAIKSMLPLTACFDITIPMRAILAMLQITAIILMPTFPGWLAPMHFNPIRFEEFLSFAVTVCGTWAGSSLLVGGYKSNATSGDLVNLCICPTACM